MLNELRLDPRIASLYRARRAPVPGVIEFARSVGFTPEDWQARFLESDAKQVILNCHRTAGKSAVVSILALHRMLTIPNYEILVLSRNDEQAKELVYNLTRAFNRLPVKPALDGQPTAHGLRLASGSRLMAVPCTEPRGFHVDMLIEDEASEVPHEVYMAARPVVMAKNGRYLMLSTPKGKTGHFWNVWSEQANWLKIKATYRDTKRYDAEKLARIEADRIECGPDWFAQEWECEFVQVSGQLIAESQIEAARGDVKLDAMDDIAW
jgi:hypothetical protein